MRRTRPQQPLNERLHAAMKEVCAVSARERGEKLRRATRVFENAATKPTRKTGTLLCMDKFPVAQQPSDSDNEYMYRGLLSQHALIKWNEYRRLLDGIEAPLTALLARGARVEPGALDAELRASRDEFGHIVLRLMVEEHRPSDSRNQPALARPFNSSAPQGTPTEHRPSDSRNQPALARPFNSSAPQGTPTELRPAAKSSCTFEAEPSEEFPCCDVDERACLNHSGELSQQALLEWSERRKRLDEIEKAIAAGLARGAKVEPGACNAELRACRDESGQIILRLVVRP